MNEFNIFLTYELYLISQFDCCTNAFDECLSMSVDYDHYIVDQYDLLQTVTHGILICLVIMKLKLVHTQLRLVHRSNIFYSVLSRVNKLPSFNCKNIGNLNKL